jgi:threonine/homoserine/homoserine lactone efflux protein
MSMLLRGIIIGLSIAAPVGPIGMLCIRRTLAEGRLAGLVSGFGAATADMLYGCIAGFGLTFISSVMVQQQVWLRLVGGLFLCYLGVKIFLALPAEESVSATGTALAGAYASTFALTLTNPMTILSFAAIFAGLGLVYGTADYVSAGLMVLGVFFGSALWWLFLSGAVGVLRGRITPRGLRWINRVSGLIVLGFGVLALMTVMAGSL